MHEPRQAPRRFPVDARTKSGQDERAKAQLPDVGRIGSPPRRAEEGQGDLVVEPLKGDLDRHVELQCLGGVCGQSMMFVIMRGPSSSSTTAIA